MEKIVQIDNSQPGYLFALTNEGRILLGQENSWNEIVLPTFLHTNEIDHKDPTHTCTQCFIKEQ